MFTPAIPTIGTSSWILTIYLLTGTVMTPIAGKLSDNPDFRYVVGKDAAMALESRRNMSDREFQNLIKKQFNL
jgi:MFS family permease